MGVWNPCYQWAKCGRTGRQGSANTSPSARRSAACLGWVSQCGRLELLRESGCPALQSTPYPLAAGFFPALILFAAYGDQEDGPKVLCHLWDASSCWWLCRKGRRKLLRTKVKSGSSEEFPLDSKRKCFAGTVLMGPENITAALSLPDVCQSLLPGHQLSLHFLHTALLVCFTSVWSIANIQDQESSWDATA